MADGLLNRIKNKSIIIECLYCFMQAAEDTLIRGAVYPLPTHRENLGKGGNGKVSKHVIAQEEFAVKEVSSVILYYCSVNKVQGHQFYY